MEEQKEIIIKIDPADDVKKSIDTIKGTSSSALGFKIGEPKVVITEYGKEAIIVPYTEPAIEPTTETIDEKVRRR